MLYTSLCILFLSIVYSFLLLYPSILKKYHYQQNQIQYHHQLTAIANNATTLETIHQKIISTPSLIRLHIGLSNQTSLEERTHQLISLTRRDQLQLISLTPQKKKHSSVIQLQLKGCYQAIQKFLNNIIYQPPFAWIKLITLSAPNQGEILTINLQVELDHA